MKNVFIFTEIFNCAKIGQIALRSFYKYHDLKVHVFGRDEDFEQIDPFSNIVRLKAGQSIIDGFKNGHKGTAMLWASVIKNRPEKYIIHFDSDDVFRGNIIDDILTKIKDGYDLIGSTRNYKNNPQNRNDIRHLDDVVSTNCFAFNKDLIGDYDYETLVRMVQGAYNPLDHITVDFFDPVSFCILKNGGKIFNLDFNDVGGCNKEGSRDNLYSEINNDNTEYKIEFGSKLVHFSGVGSGMNVYEHDDVSIPESYKNYCLDRYALFCKIFYDEDIGIDVSKYKNLLDIKDWY